MTTYSYKAFFNKRSQDMRADGDHDVPEVDGCDFSVLATVSLHKGLLRMFQLYFLQLERVKMVTLCLLLSSCK